MCFEGSSGQEIITCLSLANVQAVYFPGDLAPLCDGFFFRMHLAQFTAVVPHRASRSNSNASTDRKSIRRWNQVDFGTIKRLAILAIAPTHRDSLFGQFWFLKERQPAGGDYD